MSQDLSLVDITESSPVQLGLVQSGEVVLGRSPEVAVCLASEAVSFEHGVLTLMRGRWFFKDLGSTNGSWINGDSVTPGTWKLVREGDLLQVGDRVLRLEHPPGSFSSSVPLLRQRVLLVFKKGELIDEFPLPDSGEALIVGGPRGDLELARSESSRAALVFEVAAGGMTVRSDAGLFIVVKNGSETILPTSIKDRDEIEVEDYHIICQNPGSGAVPVPVGAVPLAQGRPELNRGVEEALVKDSWQGGESTLSRAATRSHEGRPRFGELAHGTAGDDANLAERYLGTRAGGAGRPLAHDVPAFLPLPPPAPLSFLSTTEGKWMLISIAFLLFSGFAVAALLWIR